MVKYDPLFDHTGYTLSTLEQLYQQKSEGD